MPHSNITAKTRQRARALRRDMTPAEWKLWRALREAFKDGPRFRRQSPIGPYIADFVCPAVKLVIEIDGSQHNTEAGTSADARRTLWLESQGYAILRFTNSDTLSNLDGVFVVILDALNSRLPQLVRLPQEPTP